MPEPVKLRTRLGAVVGEGSGAPEVARPERGYEPPRAPQAATLPRRQRITLWVSPGVCDSFRDAIYACPKQVTAADVAEEALQWAIHQLEERYNDGSPFPQRPEEAQQLPRGRPMR